MNSPLISIIIPMYNSEKYIQETVYSITKQNFSNYEIILIDNNSVDNTLIIAEELANNNDRIEVYKCKKQGPSAARNMGIKYSKGEYIYFIDSDDYLLDYSLKTLEEIIYDYLPEMIIFGFSIDGKNNKINTTFKIKEGHYNSKDSRKFLEKMVRSNTKFNVPSYLFIRLIKRSIIIDNDLFFDENVYRSEDFQFLVKVHYYINDMYVMYSKKFSVYRQVHSSITHTYTENYWDVVKEIFKDLIRFSVDKKDILLKEDLSYKFYVYAYLACENIIFSVKEFKQKKKLLKNIIVDSFMKEMNELTNISKGFRTIGISYLILRSNFYLIIYLYIKLKEKL
ncbi:glycosyltransferase family 2 protein [Facklamia sp. P12950]|uniref:glycosyltransferase family 2 protein n=1 Tax=unclassified Facklamia TaxID=2622293 RepID=UPI003D1825B9